MVFELEPLFNNIGYTMDISYDMDMSDVDFNMTRPFTTPVRVRGRFINSAGVVSVSAVAEFSLDLFCDRCASPIVKACRIPVEHVLVTELNDEENNIDLILLDSFRFQLDELVCDDIFLELPSKFLCKDDCAGICASCGKNLNDGPCSCKKSVDPRLEALLQLLDN
ncbi:MAG: DUF177 domain-containing protein [Clostridia bacterium]|nr:DUF177 domain-containing protein [Clostridia bacterium]